MNNLEWQRSSLLLLLLLLHSPVDQLPPLEKKRQSLQEKNLVGHMNLLKFLKMYMTNTVKLLKEDPNLKRTGIKHLLIIRKSILLKHLNLNEC